MIFIPILVAVFSGLGFGMLFFLGLNRPELTDANALLFFGVAFALILVGNLADVIGWKHPKAVAELFPENGSAARRYERVFSWMALVLGAALFLSKSSLNFHPTIVGLMTSGLSLATLLCGAMLYTSIKRVPRWSFLPSGAYILFAGIAGGAILVGQLVLSFALLGILAVVQIIDWLWGDRAANKRLKSGLTQYVIQGSLSEDDRNHKWKLRGAAFALMCILPMLALWFVQVSPMQIGLILLSHLTGLLISRALFLTSAELTTS
ncbi:MAG: hypothetical protein AAF826_09185 [Pseudomonadota bacterium]